MENTSVTTKAIIGEVRFSYVHVFEPHSISGEEPKYQMCILIPKTDTATVEKVRKAIDAAYRAGIGKFGGKLPQEWRNPLRDGDLAKSGDESFKGMWYINASSKTRPGVVKAVMENGQKRLVQITDPQEVYSGCYGFVSINFYAYSAIGNKGVAAGLNNVLKSREGEFLGGRTSPETDFTGIDIVTDEDMPELD